MASDIVQPQAINDFRVEIDNSKCNQPVTQMRLALIRTISVHLDKFHPVDDVVATQTSDGGLANKVVNEDFEMKTPAEFREAHSFNMPDKSIRKVSILAPSHRGQLITISYRYELRIWHKASFGGDNLTKIDYPIKVACPSPSF